MKVPLCRPSIGPRELERVAEVLRSGWLAHGPYNDRLEQAFAARVGVEHAVSMNSCTSALELALSIAGIRGEVIVPSFTWVATANAVVNAGATPVFCEVDPETRNVSAATLEACLTDRTEAVIPVHYGGQPCQMGPIVEFCARAGLFLLEDSAETLGASCDGAQAGSFGVACFSFFPTKNITTGEGGMLTCRDPAFAARARALISHGVESSTLAREKVERPWLRAASLPGHNYRMPNPLAALGYEQLLRLDEFNDRRVELARRYDEAFAPLAPRLRTPAVAGGVTHVYQMYTVTVEQPRRDPLVLGLRERGIGASVHFDPPVHLQPCYRARPGAAAPRLPLTEALAREIVTLPLFPDMTGLEQALVIDAVLELLG